MKTAQKQELKFTEELENGTIEPIPQRAGEGNSWRKRGKSDGQIDWRMSSKAIYNLVRSLTHPYIGAHFVHDGSEYSVWKVQELTDKGFENIEPGKIIQINTDGTVDVKVFDGIIRLVDFDKVQLKEGDYLL